MKNEALNTWTTLAEEVKFETPWIKVTKYDVLNPAGKDGIYGVVSFKNLAVGVLPIDADGYTWLVGQWRYPLKQYSWEIPEGGCPLGTDPQDTAIRELKEETGLVAKNIRELARLHTSNSVCDEYGFLYIATGLHQEMAEPEESEDLKIKKLPFTEAYQMVLNGEITDSLSMIAILKAKILMDEGQITV